MAEIKSLYPIDLQLTTHIVELGRNRQFGRLILDDQPEATGTSPGKLTGLNVDSMFYVGGHDYYGIAQEMLPQGATFMNTFHGK